MLDKGIQRWGLIASVLLVTTSLAGCAAPDTGEPVIGTLLPITGGLDDFGPDMQAAVELAVAQVNEQGGVLGQDVRLVTGDSRTDEAQAPQELRRLVQEGVVGVVGAASSGVTNSILSTAVSNEVLVVTPASTSPTLSEQDNDGFFLRVPPHDGLQGKIMAKLLSDEGITSISTLYVNNAYGQGFNTILSQEFDGTIHDAVGFDDKATSFGSEISKATEDNPDAIVYIGYPGTGVPLMRQAHEQGVTEDHAWYFSEGVKEPDFVTDVGTDQGGNYVLAGFKGTTPEDFESATLASFIEAFNETNGHAPGLFAPHSYDAALALMFAMEKAGSTDPDELKPAIREVWNSPGKEVTTPAEALEAIRDGEEIDYVGASGNFNWDERGDPVTGLYSIWRVTDEGRIEITDQGIEP